MKKTVLIHANYWDGERMCRDGRIEIADGYVGAVYGACDEQNLKPYNIEETCFEDMSGIYLFPAWIDSHLHIPGDFLFEKFGVVLTGLESLEAYLDRLSTWKKQCEKQDYQDLDAAGDLWLRGFGWSAVIMDRAENGYEQLWDFLNQEFTDKPVLLFSDDYHNCICNKKALDAVKRAGIAVEPDERGLIKEKDIFLLTRYLPEMCFSESQIEMAVLAYQEKLLSYGITAVQTLMFLGGNGLREWKVLLALERKGLLKLKVNLALTVQPWEKLEESRQRYGQLMEIEKESRFYGGHIQIHTVKLYMDGVVENHTAYMEAPYEDQAGRGKNFWDLETLREFCRELDEEGHQIHIHAIGDGAVHDAVTALVYAMDRNGTARKHRHVIAHLQIASDEDIRLMGQYGIIASIQPYWFPQSEKDYGLEKPFLGERAEEEYKARTLEAMGVLITGASDSPVTPRPAPVLGIAMAGNRCQEKERLPVPAMIRAFTRNGAYQLFRERELGMIQRGFRADLVGYREAIWEQVDGDEIPAFLMVDGKIYLKN